MTPRQRFLLIVPGALFLVAFGAFELGRLASRKEAERKYAAKQDNPHRSPAPALKQNDATLMKTLLAQNLDTRTFSFAGVIEGATERKVEPFDPALPAAAVILTVIKSAADDALKIHNEPISPIRGLRRINEASRFFEDTLREKIDAHPGLFCTIPQTPDGSEQRTGYPDLRIEHVESGTIAYLDPKLFEDGSGDSSLRTFYYSPRTDISNKNKVRDNAHHLLLGISHDGNDGSWTFTGWELIDLSKLEVRLKPEFQASNRDLYREDARLATSQPAN